MKEELCQALGKLSEMEQLREQLEASESRIEAEVMDTLTVTQKLHEQEEAMKAVMQERDNLKDIVGSLQIEKDLIKEKIEADVAQKLHNHEGAMEVLIQERDDLRRKLDVLQKQGKLATEEAETEVLHEHEEAMRALTQERDYLKDKLDALQVERDLIKEEMQAAKSMVKYY